MADLLIVVGALLQAAGVMLLAVNLRAVSRYLRQDDHAPEPHRKKRKQPLPVHVVVEGERIDLRVARLDKLLQAVRENIADLEWDLETRWDRDINTARLRLEGIFRTELGALRNVIVGWNPLTVVRVGVSSMALIVIGLGLSTCGSLIA